MIDFRYHLVSLISVFLALAVGIVLGAGPLRENLGNQLAEQVEQLRTEQDDLRTQADELETEKDQLASFITELGPDLVDGTLTGTRVAVLTDDASTRAGIDRITALLEDAGAASTVQIDLQPALWEPDQEQQRSEAIEQIRDIAPSVLGDGATSSEQLSAVIVALLSPPATGELTPELRDQLWQVFTDHQLVAVDGEAPAEVDAALYASAAPEELTGGTEDDAVATERAQSLLSSQTALLGALAGTGMPAVVSAATPGNDATTGILRTVRGDDVYDSISTTDRLQEADGPVLSVLALIEQVRGGAGAYGTTADAEDRLPALPETQGVGEDSGGGEGPTPSDGGGAE
ncbi:copper transporter [Brachybacterium sp. GCM10030268]|uniref:copper transporter n=1 Tax=Brachybacterium sp. GCM10030268 TaxID=3273382 RepID=UPI00361C92CF